MSWVFAVLLLAPPNPSEVLGFADHLLQEHDLYRAVGEYQRFLYLCADCPEAPRARLSIGDAYALGEEWGLAIEHYAQVQQEPWKTVAGGASAAVWTARRRFPEARAALQSLKPAPETLQDRLSDEQLRVALRSHDSTEILQFARARGDATLAKWIQESKVPRRSPLVGGVLAAILPGSGHLYGGAARSALMTFLNNALWISATVVSFRQEQYWLGAALGAGALVWYGGNIVGGANAVQRYNRAGSDAYFTGLENQVVGEAPGFWGLRLQWELP
jgi:hypothetical protein